MDQQIWIVRINSDQSEVVHQASELERYILHASTKVTVIQRPVDKRTQGGIVELLVTILGPSAVGVYLIRALITWIKATYGVSIDIEIGDLKVKIKGITSKNYEKELSALLEKVTEAVSHKKK
jgi:hypothetical protein